MNNPPDVTQDPKEYEEYAHGVQKHVRAYLMVGALVLTFTAVTVALSYVDFGTRKANIGIAMFDTGSGWLMTNLNASPMAVSMVDKDARALEAVVPPIFVVLAVSDVRATPPKVTLTWSLEVLFRPTWNATV